MIRSFFSILFTVLLVAGYGQSSVREDSLKTLLKTEIHDTLRGKIYMQLAGDLIRQDDSLAFRYIDSAEAVTAYVNQPYKSFKIDFLKGSIYERRQLFDTAKVFFQNIIDHGIDEVEDYTLIARSYYKFANMSRRQGSNEAAIKYANQSKEVFLENGQPDRAADSDILLGIIYKNTGQLEKALEYNKSAYEAYKKVNSYDPMATALLNMANVYSRQGKYDKALELYDESYEVAQKLVRNQGLLAYIYGNRANTYSQLNKPQESYENNLKAYEIRKNRARPEEKANSLLGLAISLKDLNRPNEAIRRLDEALEIAESSEGMLQNKMRIYNGYYAIYKKTKQHAKAIAAVDQYIMYKDSIRSTELDKKVIELNESLETERKEKEIALLNADKELNATKLNAAKRQTYGLLGGLLIISTLLFSVFRLYRKTQSQNDLISKSLKEKETLLKEIHHRVKNNLQFISSLLGLQTEHVTDKVALGALEEGQNRVQSMALIHQNLYQDDNLTGVDMKEYFIKLTRGLFDSYNIRKDQINLQLEIEDINLDVDSVIPIGLIVNELVSNSLKYAFPGDKKGVITVGLQEIDHKLSLSVRDNGIGINQKDIDKLGSSFGYRLIEVFKNQINADFHIDGENGTNVTLEIGKYDKS